MAPGEESRAEEDPAEETPQEEAGPPAEAAGLSEDWSVEGKYTGCYTGGKVAWSETAKVLGCLCSEELHLIDPATEAPSRQVSQEGDGILTFAIDPKGENACTSHRSGLLRHFRLGEPAQLQRSWRAHEQLVVDLCFDASGGLVASGSVDRTAKVWDFAGYFCTHNFKGHDGLVSIVRFHPSRLQLATVANIEVRLWDLQKSTCVGILKDHLATISSICFANTARGKYQLVSGGRDQIVNVWHIEDKCALVRTIPVFENVQGVVAVPTTGLRHACSGGNTSKEPFVQWLQQDAKLPSFVILTVGDKSLLRMWNPSDGKCISEQRSPHAAKGTLRHVLCLDEEAGRKLVTVGEDSNLVVWSLPEFHVERYIMGHNEEIVHVQFIPEIGSTGKPSSARKFVCITNDEHPRIVSCKGFGATLLRGHTDIVIACDVSADGQLVASGGKDQSVRIWSVASGRCICTLAGHAGPVSCLSFTKKRPKRSQSNSTQPLWLVSGSQDKTMKLWELPSMARMNEAIVSGTAELHVDKSKFTVIAHTKEVNDVTVSPNNKLIGSGGHDKLVRIWKFPEGDLLGECTGHRRGIWCVAFSPVDQIIASASGDTTIRIWNLKDFTAIRSFQGHSSAVLRVCFLANGMQMMSSGVDGLIKLWQIRTADCAATFEEHEGKVWCIDIVGQQMVSGGSDAKLCVWRDTTSEKAKERHDAEVEIAMKDSRIGLLVREGKIEKALTLALDLNRPGQMRQILTSHTVEVVHKCISQTAEAPHTSGVPSQNGSKVEPVGKREPESNDVDLQRWVRSLSSAQLEKLVELLEQWNSNRRMSSVAQMLMGLVLLAVPPAKLATFEGMNASCSAILSYSARHLARVESLLQKTFLLDLVLQSSTFGLSLEEPKLVAGKASGAGTGDAEDALKRTMDVLLGDQEVAGDGQEQEDEDEDDADDGEDERGALPEVGPDAHRGHSAPDSAVGGGVAKRVGGGNCGKLPRKRRKAQAPEGSGVAHVHMKE